MKKYRPGGRNFITTNKLPDATLKEKLREHCKIKQNRNKMFTVEFQPLQAKYIPSSALELERQTYKVETKKKEVNPVTGVWVKEK